MPAMPLAYTTEKSDWEKDGGGRREGEGAVEVAGAAGGWAGRSAHTPDRQPGCSQPNPARQGSSALPARCPSEAHRTARRLRPGP